MQGDTQPDLIAHDGMTPGGGEVRYGRAFARTAQLYSVKAARRAKAKQKSPRKRPVAKRPVRKATAKRKATTPVKSAKRRIAAKTVKRKAPTKRRSR
jgi:hypothetical protein